MDFLEILVAVGETQKIPPVAYIMKNMDTGDKTLLRSFLFYNSLTFILRVLHLVLRVLVLVLVVVAMAHKALLEIQH